MNEINMYSHTDEMLCKAQKILRESCDTHISIDWGCDGYSFSIIKKDEEELFTHTSYNQYYETYEDCLRNAITVCHPKILEGIEEVKCLFCNSYKNGWCTNFGQNIKEDNVCKFYRANVF